MYSGKCGIIFFIQQPKLIGCDSGDLVNLIINLYIKWLIHCCVEHNIILGAPWTMVYQYLLPQKGLPH